MKRNFVVMAFTALILGLCCMSCEKENNIEVDEIKITNPYDFLGNIHNDALEFIYEQSIQNNPIDIAEYAKDITASRFSELFAQFSKDDIITYLDKTDNQSAEISLNSPLFNSRIDFNNEFFAPIQLTTYQRITLQELFDKIEYATSTKDIWNYLILKESEILANKSIKEDEKAIVLETFAITKYSYIFHTTHYSESKQKPSFQQIKKALKADGIGFLAGCVASFFNGAAEASLVLGPEGVVVAVVANGTRFAIRTSAAQLISIIVQS